MIEDKNTRNIIVCGLITTLCTLIIASTASAGYVIGDYVWYDTNGDGIQGADEPAVEGVIVNVYDCLGNPIEPLSASVDTTNEAGWYRIVLATWPPPEPFYLEFVMPDVSTYNFTLKDQGSDDILDSDVDSLGRTQCFTWPDNKIKEIWDFDAGVVEKTESCGDCMGKVTQLTLQYNGTSSAIIKVVQKIGVVFENYVISGKQFTFHGTDKNGTLGNEISIYVNNKLSTKIHTSCSEPIGPGLISGDFEIIEGYSKDGGLLCPVQPSEDCGCEGNVNQLTLQYLGTSEEPITVTQKEWKKQLVIFSEDGINDIVTKDGVFTINGLDKYGTFGSEISIYVGNNLNTKIHTSCSEPIGPGLISGDFLVVEGYSRKGGALCPVQSSEDCNCDGKVTELKLKYKGKSKQPVVIVQEKDDEPVFIDYVEPGDQFTVKGHDKKGTLGTEISIYVGEDMNLHTKIHTSCSKPIGSGLIFGDFEVIEGYSRKGGPLRSYGDD